MREIKFRAWDKNEEEMIEAEYLAGPYSSLILSSEGVLYSEHGPGDETWHESESDNYILMQYTGLKDKNGKKIYEGDILDFNGYPSEIRFEDGGYIFDNNIPGQYGIEPFDSIAAKTYTVIGNIYKNKEILK